MRFKKMKDARIGIMPFIAYVIFTGICIAYLFGALPFETFVFAGLVVCAAIGFDNAMRDEKK